MENPFQFGRELGAGELVDREEEIAEVAPDHPPGWKTLPGDRERRPFHHGLLGSSICNEPSAAMPRLPLAGANVVLSVFEPLRLSNRCAKQFPKQVSF